MKNQILDELTQHSLPDFLKKGETILWEGQPKFKTKFFSVLLGDRKALTLIASFLGLIFLIYFCLIFLIPILLGILLSNFIKRKKTVYFITNQQIIFQLWRRGKKQFHQIPFSAIQDLVIQEDRENYGVIFLAIKNPQSLQFDTYNLRSGKRRHQPTFEMIEDVREVALLIRQGIQQNN